MADTEVVLRNDNPLVNYTSGTWVPSSITVDGGSSDVKCAESPGSVSVTYNFHSVAVWAYYSPGSDVPQLTCTIDGRSVQVLDPPDTSENPNVWWSWYVCQGQGLASQNHTVELAVTEATQEMVFCLDTFDVKTSQLSQLIQESTTTTTSPSSSASAGAAAKAKTPVGAIVGFTIGGIALTLGICGALFFWYRRRKQHQYARMSGDDGDFDRSSMHSRRQNTLLSFSFRPWGRKKQRKEPEWVEARHPVVLAPPLLEKTLHAQREDDTESRRDFARADSYDFVPEERTVSLQDLGFPGPLGSDHSEESHGNEDPVVPAHAALSSPPITPQSVETSDPASLRHFTSSPIDSGPK
ncbi:hypothetical protein L227DRAFT_578641 [Lentinus tigrinus ALCF2SS1-6]|uniref:Uncharacterized protein n=1 Tax=Lentinus tigrinus ALCF2SS1-6 TaxID=1328759 RepID=A0A5C2S097_9APHY|nr:hypothetical protein L227DRAFT_578641 [Lentinus tigrinus ALCF2SS1-6]